MGIGAMRIETREMGKSREDRDVPGPAYYVSVSSAIVEEVHLLVKIGLCSLSFIFEHRYPRAVNQDSRLAA